MAVVTAPVSDLLVTTKSREFQRAELADARGDRAAAIRHFLAAAHLELVLSTDYSVAGRKDLANRSLIGAASCFWRGGEYTRSREILSEMSATNGDGATLAADTIVDLEANFPETR
jgi:hypothetical protein